MARRATLRRLAFQIALAVVLTPLLGVMFISGIESLFGDRIRENTEESAALVSEALTTRGVDAARELAARRARKHHQRIRVLDSEGVARVDENALIGRGPRHVLGDILYGPERVFVLERLDRDFGPPLQRAEVVEALASGRDGSCRASIPGNLFLCAAAVKVAGPRVVLVEGSSRRALQAVYESRRQLAKLLLFTAALGIGLAWWTVRTFVRPVEALRSELLARATEAVPKALSLPAAPRRTMGRPRELGELTEAFNTVLTALSERTRTNEAFLADLAHEFKNPVAAVRACAERLAEPGPLDPARQERLAEALKQSAVRLDSLVTQFLELARAEAGLPNEEREPMDVGAHLEGLVGALRNDPRHEGVRFELTRPPGALVIQGVPQRLELAFRSLLENAASFAGREGWVRVTVSAGPASLQVAISDSGPGIPEADLPRLFNRFFTRRGDRHGTGLGLALARAVVEAHGGRIEVRSPPGEGATFVVGLPFTHVSHASR
ncbi:HAMP domain-containing histidine kinase [Pyxidicoccus fallax]|uniref:histidine kinase n=1 Tax=Pyxidicoccus fallax TaxID=394095 RepID=A0A848LFY9_9BACT|nr:HAMP domain-containing sensor histidine kinase [Pyxidicoccus fallax]NMO17362.1 HAMP domain-containing histidine kinase [Pyxidicoccus fallax]NPC81294.1 HAMP domain-containing histidine kinase [Pyxidicoccus fallax]